MYIISFTRLAKVGQRDNLRPMSARKPGETRVFSQVTSTTNFDAQNIVSKLRSINSALYQTEHVHDSKEKNNVEGNSVEGIKGIEPSTVFTVKGYSYSNEESNLSAIVLGFISEVNKRKKEIEELEKLVAKAQKDIIQQHVDQGDKATIAGSMRDIDIYLQMIAQHKNHIDKIRLGAVQRSLSYEVKETSYEIRAKQHTTKHKPVLLSLREATERLQSLYVTGEVDVRELFFDSDSWILETDKNKSTYVYAAKTEINSCFRLKTFIASGIFTFCIKLLLTPDAFQTLAFGCTPERSITQKGKLGLLQHGVSYKDSGHCVDAFEKKRFNIGPALRRFDTLQVVIDMTKRQIQFRVNGKCCGIACKKLPVEGVWPTISVSSLSDLKFQPLFEILSRVPNQMFQTLSILAMNDNLATKVSLLDNCLRSKSIHLSQSSINGNECCVIKHDSDDVTTIRFDRLVASGSTLRLCVRALCNSSFAIGCVSSSESFLSYDEHLKHIGFGIQQDGFKFPKSIYEVGNYCLPMQQSCLIEMIIDMNQRQLRFIVDRANLGVCCFQLPEEGVYPAISIGNKGDQVVLLSAVP